MLHMASQRERFAITRDATLEKAVFEKHSNPDVAHSTMHMSHALDQGKTC